MSARVEVCLAAALLLAAAPLAAAASYQPSIAPAAPPSGPSTAIPQGPDSDAYNKAATDDPYNQPDFSNAQSFGLVASQMLGAAAACEQYHSDRASLGAQQLAKAGGGSSDRSALDTAQQYMLDPAATGPNGVADCDRMGTDFSKLQELQFQNQAAQASATSPAR